MLYKEDKERISKTDREREREGRRKIELIYSLVSQTKLHRMAIRVKTIYLYRKRIEHGKSSLLARFTRKQIIKLVEQIATLNNS